MRFNVKPIDLIFVEKLFDFLNKELSLYISNDHSNFKINFVGEKHNTHVMAIVREYEAIYNIAVIAVDQYIMKYNGRILEENSSNDLIPLFVGCDMPFNTHTFYMHMLIHEFGHIAHSQELPVKSKQIVDLHDEIMTKHFDTLIKVGSIYKRPSIMDISIKEAAAELFAAKHIGWLWKKLQTEQWYLSELSRLAELKETLPDTKKKTTEKPKIKGK